MCDMAGSPGGYIRISETNIPALKEALFDQQQLLQKLYGELDAEREATASAANETLSMILRLQEEKAAVMMEAKQYKRLAEEKMCHAEQTLEVLEELIYHKEMEVASLEFQVQAYRYKLMSLGWNSNEFGSVAESRFPEGFLSASNIARAISLPTMKGRFPNLEKLPSFKVEEYYDPEDDTEDEPRNNSGDIDSYWEQIQKLDERVKEISRESFSVTIPPSPLPVSERSNRHHFGEFKRGEDESVANCSGFRDVSVVPQSEDANGYHKVKGRGKFVTFGENVVFGEKPDWVLEKHNREIATVFQDRETQSPRQKDESDNVTSGFRQICVRIEKLERNVRCRETAREGEEEIVLLKEIKDQLNCIQKDMTLRKNRKTRPEDGPMITLMEAMLHFW